MIVYNKNTGNIVAQISDDQRVETHFFHYPDEFKDNLASVILEHYPQDLESYRVQDNELVRLLDKEVKEIQQYGDILTDDERLEIRILESLIPSQREMEQAELMIKLLPILKEVMSIE